jgi:hypothetical protein
MENNLLARFLKGKYTTSAVNEKNNQKKPRPPHVFQKI